jgi:MoaA/NifB/PqqE/SkfB family radical SAM enzyme
MTATSWYVNVNYVCNERCTFCAAELAGGSLRIDGRLASVSVEDVERWLGPERPDPADRVMLAGGEPTLHRGLVPIAGLLGSHGARLTIFTNGLRLADPSFAAAVASAGITDYEIPFYGADAESHEAVTRRRGSFDSTLAAVDVLSALKHDHDIRINVRLLVSRQSVWHNPGIVRLLHDRGARVDSFSVERLILSEDAKAASAEISWAEAGPSVNASAELVRALGYELRFDAVPLCVFTEDNAVHVRARLSGSTRPRESPRQRYLDPYVAAGLQPEVQPPKRRALPDPCVPCAYRNRCGRVERWYLERYGTAGLHPVTEPIAVPVTIGPQ